MLVRYRMSSKVVTVEPQRSLADARRLLTKHRIRQLPVLRGPRLVGIVTDRDLRAAPAGARAAADVMTAKPFTIAPDVPVDEAARLLREHKINALPVVEKSKLIGILTTSDVLNAFIDLSGVAEPTYRLVLASESSKLAVSAIRPVIERAHGEVKWIHQDPRRATVAHVRLKTRRIDDVVTALEAAGLEVTTVIAPPRGRA